MAVLGIITCKILELEVAHLLSNDPDLAGVTVLEDIHSLDFIEALETTGLTPSRILILRGFTPNYPGQLEVMVRVLELALVVA